MRFVPTYCLREGMILADNLYGKSGAILLTRGTILNETFLTGIQKHQYTGIYIDDDFSKDIEIIGVINQDLRVETVKGIENIFIASENSQKIGKRQAKDMESFVSSIVDEILGNRNLVINMVDIKVFDDYTYYHSVNVAVLSIVMGVALEFDRKQLQNLCLGALLHDLGKVFVPKNILDKEGKLTAAEFEEVKKHPQTGYEYIEKAFHFSDTVMSAIMDHHERYDGTGYPAGRTSKNISSYAKIIAIADVYDALTSDRPYRKAMLPSEAIELIMGSAGTHFEPELVETFLKKIAPYPIGTLVKLSNGCTGIVIDNYENYCLRPIIRILEENGREVAPYIIDLTELEFSNVTIVGIS